MYIYTVEYYTAVRKNEVVKLAYRRLDKESIMLSERSQKGRDRCRMSAFICGTLKK